tara:strand:- start:935 stop:1117 length:183 start_codon:yes stop_codon:yes gene_type:complete
METLNIISYYLLGGVIFAIGFEYLAWKVKAQHVAHWERIFWVTCWPYCIYKFLNAYFKKD